MAALVAEKIASVSMPRPAEDEHAIAMDLLVREKAGSCDCISRSRYDQDADDAPPSPLSDDSDVVDLLLPAMKKLRIGWVPGSGPLPNKVNKKQAQYEGQFVLDRPAAYFFQNGTAGEAAWVALQMYARVRSNVILFRRTDGSIRSQLQNCTAKKRYPGTDDFWDEAQTIEFVYLNNGALRFAQNMWHNEMLFGEREDKGSKRAR